MNTKQEKNKRVTVRENLFCCYYHHYRNGKEAAIQAGYSPKTAERTAARLLQRKEIQALYRKLDREENQQLRNDVIAGLKRLAFGSVTDGVRLLFEEGTTDWESLDLFSVSEMKCPKNGVFEIKFFDRFQALQKLLELTNTENSQDGITALYHALEQGAKALEKQEEIDED